MKKLIVLVIVFLSVQAVFSQVKYAGVMSETGKFGFASAIALDTLKAYEGLLALGPLGKMEGGITVLDGKLYGGKSSISGEAIVVNDWNMQAPFLVYADVRKWEKIKLTGKVETLLDLEEKIKEAVLANGINLEAPFFLGLREILIRWQLIS